MPTVPGDQQEDTLTQASALESGDFIRIVKNLAGLPNSQVMSREVLRTYLTTSLGLNSSIAGAYTITTAIQTTPNNALVVYVKGGNGQDFSASNPLKTVIGNAEYTITSPLSVFVDLGNYFNAGCPELAGRNVDYFVYLVGENAGAVRLALSRIPYAVYLGDVPNSVTDDKSMIGYSSYSGFACRVIGRVRAMNSGSPNFTWSLPANLIFNHPIYFSGILSAGLNHQGFSSIAQDMVSYVVHNNFVSYNIDVGGVSNSTLFKFGVPFNSTSYNLCGWVTDASNFQAYTGLLEGVNAHLINVFKAANSFAFTASGSKRITGKFTEFLGGS